MVHTLGTLIHRSVLLLFVMMVAAGCSGGGSSPNDSPSPTATDFAGSPTSLPTQTASPATPQSDCPIQNDICALADTFLVAFKTGHVDKVVGSAKPQRLTCPDASDASPEISSLRITCGSRSPGSEIDVYEFHTGKGPVFYPTLAEYQASVTDARSGTSQDDVSVRAVGCGLKKDSMSSSPDCSTASVVVLQLRFKVGDEASETALVFSRSSATMDWTIEKYWQLFPYDSLPDTVTPGLRRNINTVGGVVTVELYPYSPE